MCVAAPGKVISVEDGYAKVDYDGNIIKAHAGIVSGKPGDYVLVHAGMIIQTIKQQEAEEMTALFKELEEI